MTLTCLEVAWLRFMYDCDLRNVTSKSAKTTKVRVKSAKRRTEPEPQLLLDSVSLIRVPVSRPLAAIPQVL
jgi:hypothetical protein